MAFAGTINLVRRSRFRILAAVLASAAAPLWAEPSKPVDAPSMLAPWRAGLVFGERSRTGPLFISVARDVGGPFPSVEGHWSRDWVGGRRTIETKGGRTIERWLGYRLPGDGVKGDFDVEVEYTVRRGQCDVRTFLTNRLSLGVFDLRHVFRVCPEATPTPGRTYVLFGLDEWVRDPVALLTTDRVQRLLPTSSTAYVDEGAGHGLYRNRCSPRPMISLHSERFGLMVHDLDHDNAAPGSLLIGSNDGALEFGWTYRAPGEHKPANGRRGERTQVGPAVRFVALPTRADPENGWWDTLRAYKAHAARAGLLPRLQMKDRNVPAGWARDSLSLVVNVGMPVAGDPQRRIDPGPAVETIRKMARFYRASGQRRFTPMLWGWSAVGPYRAPAGFDALLAGLKELERELDVEIRPAVYLHGCMLSKAAIGTPLEACLMRDLRGKPFTWGGDLYNAHADHPLFVAEIERTVRDMVRRGVRGFYFDAPFGEETPDYGRDGADREHHVAIRRMLQRVERTVSRLGGGVISHEAQRLGLPGMKGAAGPTVSGAYVVPFTEALYHELEIPIFFGDLAGVPYSLAAADARITGSGTYQSDDDIVRLAIEGAVTGRAAVMCFGLDRPYHEMGDSAGWAERAMHRMAAVAMSNGLRARREHREIRTGRMLPCPSHEATVNSAYLRPWVYIPKPEGAAVEIQKDAIEVRSARVPVAFYQDTESRGRYLLVVGNPTQRPITMRFTLTRHDLPGWAGSMDRMRIENADILSRTGLSVEMSVQVPPSDLACVTVRVSGESGTAGGGWAGGAGYNRMGNVLSDAALEEVPRRSGQ